MEISKGCKCWENRGFGRSFLWVVVFMDYELWNLNFGVIEVCCRSFFGILKFVY